MSSDAPELPRMRRADQSAPIVRIQIAGRDIELRPFVENTHALLVNRDGACVGVSRHLAPSQRVVVRNLHNGSETACRVVGPVASNTAGRVYGIAFLVPNPIFWDIRFPPDSVRADGWVLLKCEGCHRSHLAHLDELEALVLKANSRLSRDCKACGKLTIWRRTEQERSRRPSTGSILSPPSPKRDERKAMRVKARLAACLRHSDLGEEVTWTVDVSRAGLRLQSAKHYPPGLLIDLALFYSPTGANIFSPAQIVRAIGAAGESHNEYGVAYLPVGKK